MDNLANFHFLRPLWFLALIPLIWLAYHLLQQHGRNSGLENHINPRLLDHLIVERQTSKLSLTMLGMLMAWFIAIFILAGPSWKQLPQPLLQSESAVIIALDLSPSMRAEDNKPSRIIRAQLKIQDVLSQRKEGLTALIVYAGEAHVVTPFTDDSKTISNLLLSLQPGILPVPGSNTEMAIRLAMDLVAQAKLNKASILLVSDAVDPVAADAIANELSSNIQLTLLGIGTEAGATIPNKGDFLKDDKGNIIIAKRNSAVMQALADKVNGYYLPMQNDGSDIDLYQSLLEDFFANSQGLENRERQYDRWHEFGPTLLLILLPLLACFYRRGLLLNILAIGLTANMLILPSEANASAWDWLWKNQNQRAHSAYDNENYEDAAKEFNHKQWKGSALYKSGDYDGALDLFQEDSTAIGDYNRGNALAKLQRYENAIAAYEQALAKDENLEAARKNKALLESLLKDQQQQNSTDSTADDNSQSETQDSQQQSSQEKDSTVQGQSEQESPDSSLGKQQEQQDQRQEPNQDASRDEQANAEENKPEQSQQQDKGGKPSTNEEKSVVEDTSEALQGLSAEERQALDQWLRKIPDDPSGLLREKFEYEYQKRRRLYQEGKWQLPENNAHQRY